ncbi:MAG TPA: hypothetical protein VGW58_10535 [Pyrinomonadaceae bacterium]|nr:hypothetical protein [Pyrinomonadaceae bacterium]
MRVKLAVLMFFVCVAPVLGQTASDMEQRFGKPVPVYSVSEHIWMTPEYATDGQVCRMTLYPKRTSGNTNYVGVALQFKELRDLLNSLVPPDKRGLKTDLNFGATATGGPAVWTTYPYEKVTFTFISSMFKTTEPTLLRKDEFEFTIPATRYVTPRENLTASADDFIRSETSKTEIVTIQWRDRECP